MPANIVDDKRPVWSSGHGWGSGEKDYGQVKGRPVETNVRNEGSEDDGYCLHPHLISRHKEGEVVESNLHYRAVQNRKQKNSVIIRRNRERLFTH